MRLLLIPTILIFISNIQAEYSDSLTTCLRMKFTNFPNFGITLENSEGVDFLQVGVRDDGMLGVRLWIVPSSPPISIYLMSNDEENKVTPVHLYPRQWHHLCMQVVISSKQLMTVLVRISADTISYILGEFKNLKSISGWTYSQERNTSLGRK